VIHKNDTGLDQDGIYGLAATPKSLVSEAVAQRHYLEKVGICSDELSHTVFCRKQSIRLIDHRPVLQGEIRYFIRELEEGLLLL